VFALVVDPVNPQVVYAGGWGRIFKSTNGGASWKDVTTQQRWTRVTALAINPKHPATLYAGTERGISRTTDGGRTWRSVSLGLFDGEKPVQRQHRLFEGFISKLIIDAQRPETVFALTSQGLFRSTNGGARWRIIGPPPFQRRDNGAWPAAAIDPARARTIYASWRRDPTTNLYKSTNGGDSWRRISGKDQQGGFQFLAVDPHRLGTLLYAPGFSERGIFKSTDAGKTWAAAGLATHQVMSLSFDPHEPGSAYAITDRGALKSTDGGATWRPFGRRTAFGYGALVIDPRASETVYGIENWAGVVKSVDGGRTWAEVNSGLVSSSVSSVVVAPGRSQTLYAAPWQGVFKSTEGGRGWRPANHGLENKSVIALAVSPRRPAVLYAGTWQSGVFTSTDGGLHWRAASTGPRAMTVPALAIDPQAPNTVYAGSAGRGVFKTLNGGKTWRATGLENVGSLAVDPRNGSTVYAGTARGLFRSTDGASTWRRIATAPGAPIDPGKIGSTEPDTFAAIVIDPRHPESVYAALRTGGMLKSSDGGDTWVAANRGLTSKHIRALVIDPHHPQNLYVSADGGVFRTTNGARTWQPFNRGLRTPEPASLAVDRTGRTIFAGTQGQGVVALTLSK
jgi:photosystem II stability/assembly factor-like uncharacterized protein